MLGYLDCKRTYNNQSCKARHSWNQVKKPAKNKANNTARSNTQEIKAA